MERTQIIGSDLRMAEQITGRLTWSRALLAGGAGGAWFGLSVGVVRSAVGSVSAPVALAWGLGRVSCSAPDSPPSATP